MGIRRIVFEIKNGEIEEGGKNTWLEIRMRLVSSIDVVSQNYTHFIATENMPFPIDTFSSTEAVCVGIIRQNKWNIFFVR